MPQNINKMLSTVALLFRERRLPWFIEHRLHTLRNHVFHKRNKLLKRKQNHVGNLFITFKCGFHGNTGGMVAIAGIANLLASRFNVEFELNGGSNFNRFLSSEVHTVKKCSDNADIYICDVTCDHDFMLEVKENANPVLVSCHGLRNALHGLTEDRVTTSLSHADHVHFISSAQQDSFGLEVGKFTIIPNTTSPVIKTQRTNNVGLVGNLIESRKNADATVRVGLASNAESIQLWGANTDRWQNSRVHAHPFETNRETIYNSFDCLVFLSKLETFGLVVIEAMSAGIPCVLSELPAFEHFRDSPGVVFVNPDDTEAASQAVNHFLKNRDELAEPLREYYKNNFSTEAVTTDWEKLINRINKKPI